MTVDEVFEQPELKYYWKEFQTDITEKTEDEWICVVDNFFWFILSLDISPEVAIVVTRNYYQNTNLTKLTKLYSLKLNYFSKFNQRFGKLLII